LLKLTMRPTAPIRVDHDVNFMIGGHLAAD